MFGDTGLVHELWKAGQNPKVVRKTAQAELD